MPKKKGKKLDPKTLDQHIEAYSDATVSAQLEDAFGQWDKRYDLNTTIPYLDRADHIIINGRTVTDLLVEKFNRDLPNMTLRDGNKVDRNNRTQAYAQYYHDHGKQAVNQMVFSALANGENVEVYVPDKRTGQIKDPPSKLTPTGYDLAGPLVQPAQLTGWQKFWNFFGFYKKEKAAVVNYENEVAARKKVAFCNKVGRANNCGIITQAPAYRAALEKYHPDTIEDLRQTFPGANGDIENLDETNGFRTFRSSYYTLATLVLATKRDKNGNLLYTNEQLFDENDPEMQEARANAMKEVYDHYKSGGLLKAEQDKKEKAESEGKTYEIDPELEKKAAADRDWLVKLQYDAADVMPERINKQAEKLDFSKPDLTEQKGYREFGLLSDATFDMSQDVSSNQKQLDQKYGKGAYYKVIDKVSDCSQFPRELGRALFNQRHLVNGLSGDSMPQVCTQLAPTFMTQAYQQQIGKQLKENPGMKYTDAANATLLAQTSKVKQETVYDDFAVRDYNAEGKPLPTMLEQNLRLTQEYVQDPKQFSKQIQDGVLEGRMKLNSLADPASMDLTAPAADFEIRDAKTVEREMKQQQQQKNAGGMEL